jgi:hypothetical protein
VGVSAKAAFFLGVGTGEVDDVDGEVEVALVQGRVRVGKVRSMMKGI